MRKLKQCRGPKLKVITLVQEVVATGFCTTMIPCFTMQEEKNTLTRHFSDAQLPRSNKECPKCHETEAVFFQSQQRTAETGMVCLLAFREWELFAYFRYRNYTMFAAVAVTSGNRLAHAVTTWRVGIPRTDDNRDVLAIAGVHGQKTRKQAWRSSSIPSTVICRRLI